VTVIAVEPKGSTIFGGTSGEYLSVGSGLTGPSGIVIRGRFDIDYYCQIDDIDSVQEANAFRQAEGVNVGITTGSALVVSHYLAHHYPKKTIVAVSPDGGEKYIQYLQDARFVGLRNKHDRLVRLVSAQLNSSNL
jgi:cysteine synthase